MDIAVIEKTNDNFTIHSCTQLIEYMKQYFTNSFTKEENFKIGLEYEKILVDASFKAVPYYGENGVAKFLEYLQQNYSAVMVSENNKPLGLIIKNSSFNADISLEPGAQLEYSTKPKKNVTSIYNELSEYNKRLYKYANEFNIKPLGYGIQPISTFRDIQLLPKERYTIMNEYLPTKAKLPQVMMRETSGVQVAFDYSSEEDAMSKLRVALKLSPIVSAIFANSPIRAGKDTGYKSFRAYSWLNTDEERCGLISRKIFDKNIDFTFEDYTNILLDLPMVFLNKNNTWLNMKGMSFRKFINDGYEGYKPKIKDWFLHMTSFFPDVRFRNFIEVRNCDCLREDLLYSVPAFWKAVMYDSSAREAIETLLAGISYDEFELLRKDTPKEGLNILFKGKKLSYLTMEILNIVDYSLKYNFEDDESLYIQNIKKLVHKSKSPADVILEHWHGDWNKNVDKLVEYSML